MATLRTGHDPLRRLKWVVSVAACTGLFTRVVFPGLNVDAVSLGFLALAFLPWLSPLIKSAELPGGVKIEFQDVKAAARKITGTETVLDLTLGGQSDFSFISVAAQDPALAVVGLRIEIEKVTAQADELERFETDEDELAHMLHTLITRRDELTPDDIKQLLVARNATNKL